jgi:hypothetical protein
MRWLNIKTSESHRFLLLKRFLLFSIILCFLAALNFSLADELTDPTDPAWEHPWDDLDHENAGGGNDQGVDLTDQVLVLQFGGIHFWVMIGYQTAPSQAQPEMETSSKSVERNRGRVLMLIR